jgi:hypothetical protein
MERVPFPSRDEKKKIWEFEDEEDLHFPSWHNLIREVMGYNDRSEFECGNDDLVEYWMSVRGRLRPRTVPINVIIPLV